MAPIGTIEHENEGLFRKIRHRYDIVNIANWLGEILAVIDGEERTNVPALALTSERLDVPQHCPGTLASSLSAGNLRKAALCCERGSCVTAQ